MISALAWYLTLSIAGWLAFPLTFRLLPALKGRGYALSRALGLLLWAYIFWILASLHLAHNTGGGALTALTFTAAISAAVGYKRLPRIIGWLKENKGYVIATEIVFLAAFAGWAWVRGFIPEAVGTEKPMELAFINAILRSPTFPPHDPWLSGYAISYYYFGYVMMGMIARLWGIAGTVAFNLGLVTAFSLTVTGAFGVAYDLIRPKRAWVAVLAPIFVAITGNWEGLLDSLHSRGLLSPAFWRWLGIKDLTTPPQAPFSWAPHRFWWWWRASRVVSDFNLQKAPQEVIDEFPFFSYLLGDLHPHVLAYPFAVLAVGLALNLYRGGGRGKISLFGEYDLSINLSTFALASLALGGMAFLNTWDFPIYVGLFAAAYALRQAKIRGWKAQIAPFIVLGVALGVVGGVLYLPFYVGFSSQAGGILPNLINPTRGAQLWVMFGVLLVPIFLWAGAEITVRKAWQDALRAFGWAVAFALGLFLLALALGWGIVDLLPRMGVLLHSDKMRSAGSALLAVNGAPSWGVLWRAAFSRHFGNPWGTLTLAAALGIGAALLQSRKRKTTDYTETTPATSLEGKGGVKAVLAAKQPYGENATPFVALLVVFGALLVLAPNFFYLRDQFGTRMNTVFKFYYQGWLLWALAAAYAATAIARLRLKLGWALQAGWIIALLAGLVYPAFALPNRCNNFHAPPWGWTLDAGAAVATQNPQDWAAMRFLWQEPLGALAEAVGGSYTQYARLSTYSGQPAVLGWPGHESQWRGGASLFAGREQDVKRLYEAPDWQTAQAIISRYNIRYIAIGALERQTYAVQEAKFRRHLIPIFSQGQTVIYAVSSER